MGQKVSPIGLRLQINRTWTSRWFSEGKQYKDDLLEDFKLRKLLKKQLEKAGISSIEIERSENHIHFIITVARPGIVIGRGGSGIDELRDMLQSRTGAKVKVDIREVEHADLDAQVVAESIANQIQRRIHFRRAMKQAVDKSMQAGAEGIKVRVSGRLNGAEIARSEWTHSGRVPLHTLKADIDYASVPAFTTYGVIGIKVWIYKGVKGLGSYMEQE